MIYLDNASTTFPKPETVYREMDRCQREYCANPGRGGHKMSRIAGEAVLKTRKTIADFFGFKDPIRLCFTRNASEALNFAIKGILKPGDHVITTSMEHNSVVRPLKTLEKASGVELSFIYGDKFGEVDPETVAKAIKPNTRLIISTVSSNINGIIMPVSEIGKIARSRGIPFLVDASQGAGTIKIDVKEMQIDLLAFPGHKGLMGPQGSGGLYVSEEIDLDSIIQGGTGSVSYYMYQPDEMPEHLEAGTVNTPGIIGLGQGIEYINNSGIDRIRKHKHQLIERFHVEFAHNDNICIYSKNNIDKNSGIFAFNIEGFDPQEVGRILDQQYDTAIRAGLHCAPLAHKTVGAPETGEVRISVGCFNTMEEIEFTIEALRAITDKKVPQELKTSSV